MTEAALKIETREIVVDEVFPHAPSSIWKTLTTPDLMGRWLMKPIGFEPVVGNRFTHQTTPMGKWDGVIHCEILEVKPNERLVYTWKGGDDGNVDYGSRLDTVLTFTLEKADAGTRVRLVHSGFRLPANHSAYEKFSPGWREVLKKIGAISGERDS